MKKIVGKLFLVTNGNQTDIHARVIEDQGPREITVISDVKKPEHYQCWVEFCKCPVTHLWILMHPETELTEYLGSCIRHANQITWLPDWQQIIKL